MGKKSVKENKSVYQLAREELSFSRSDVADKTNNIISENNLYKYENNLSPFSPYEVKILADLYNKPELYNYYCTNECEIGKIHVPMVETIHDLPQITLGLLSSLKVINQEKDNLIDISADGIISDDEKESFNTFYEHLKELSLNIEVLKLWTEKNLDK